MVVVDAGAEYKGYASDITRTFPINGKFTQAQRDIYDLVLETQMSCIDMVRPGVRLEDLKTHSVEMLTEGMVRLGLLKGDPKKLIERCRQTLAWSCRLDQVRRDDDDQIGLMLLIIHAAEQSAQNRDRSQPGKLCA